MSDDELIHWSSRGYPEPIARISRRIAPGWWNKIETGRGWWPLLARLDASLAALDPDYTLHGVASKSGALNYLAVSTRESSEFDDILWAGMLAASRSCEVCGSPGTRRDDRRDRVQILCERHSRSLSNDEKRALLETGVPEIAFIEAGNRAGAAHAAASAAFTAAIARTHLTEREVSALLQVDVATVHELFRAGELAGAERELRVVYPRWQFTGDGRILRGLARVLARFPDRYTWFEIRSVMLRPDEDLAMSPRDWLAADLPISPVTALLLGLNYT